MILDDFCFYFQLNIVHLCRIVSRATSHTLPAGSFVQAPEAKSRNPIVSDSSQYIATRREIGGGDSASM